jgi:hypothetical protein
VGGLRASAECASAAANLQRVLARLFLSNSHCAITKQAGTPTMSGLGFSSESAEDDAETMSNAGFPLPNQVVYKAPAAELEAGREEAGGDGVIRAHAKAGEEAAGVSDKKHMLRPGDIEKRVEEEGGERTAAVQANGQHVEGKSQSPARLGALKPLPNFDR